MNKQKGIALVICMIVLGILTLLAVSAMSTSTAMLVMAGNEQYRARALSAAQAGIETVIAAGGFNSSIPLTTVTAPLADGDSYTASIRPRGTSGPPPGYNGAFTAEHYEIESAGVSLRNAQVTAVQGFYLVMPTLPSACGAQIEINSGVCVPAGTLIRSYWKLKNTE